MQTRERRTGTFRLGIALIATSYAMWAAMLACGTMALRNTGFPWLQLGFAAFVLNWVLFVIGIALAGKEGASIVQRVVVGFVVKRGRNKKQ